MKYVVKAAVAACALALASPALATPCDIGLPTPDATACAGYFAGNLLNGSPTDRANQQNAIASLPGPYTWDGNWSALVADGRSTTSLQNGNQLNFGRTLFGVTIIGAHFGNVAGPAGNVSVFWLFDFGTTGANFVTLDNPQGWSNAALYTTGTRPPTVPEPATWGMILLGIGVAGAAIRRSRRKNAMLAQIA